MGKTLLAGVLGGMLVFAWGAVSWMVLPWHAQTLHPFQLEGAVQQSFDAHAPASGISLLPCASHEKMPASPFSIVVRASPHFSSRNEKCARRAVVYTSFLIFTTGVAFCALSKHGRKTLNATSCVQSGFLIDSPNR